MYETISVLLYEAVLLIGRTDPTALFCSSNDLGESLINVAPYCTISGKSAGHIVGAICNTLIKL